jgi:hypothetical protein
MQIVCGSRTLVVWIDFAIDSVLGTTVRVRVNATCHLGCIPHTLALSATTNVLAILFRSKRFTFGVAPTPNGRVGLKRGAVPLFARVGVDIRVIGWCNFGAVTLFVYDTVLTTSFIFFNSIRAIPTTDWFAVIVKIDSALFTFSQVAYAVASALSRDNRIITLNIK